MDKWRSNFGDIRTLVDSRVEDSVDRSIYAIHVMSGSVERKVDDLIRDPISSATWRNLGFSMKDIAHGR